MISVVVADDQALVRSGFAALLGAEDDIDVVGEAATGEEAVHLVARLNPDVTLMDIRMPVLNGIDAIGRIRGGTAGARTRIVVLTTFGLDDYVFAALRAGADGFLLKDTSAAELVDCVRRVHEGESVLSPAVTRILIDDLIARPTSVAARVAPELTPRERDILQGVCDGLSNPQVAARLNLSPATVKAYVSRLLEKFGVESRVGLVIAAHQTGLLR
jgi:DNA-binding NarL/FixJ family response regulator